MALLGVYTLFGGLKRLVEGFQQLLYDPWTTLGAFWDYFDLFGLHEPMTTHGKEKRVANCPFVRGNCTVLDLNKPFYWGIT